MNTRRHSGVTRWLVLALSVGALMGCPTLPVLSTNLFLSDAPPERLRVKQATAEAWVTETRIARLNDFHFFNRAYEPGTGIATTFNLFDDVQFTVTARDYSQVGSGTVIWHGSDSEGSTFRIALAIVGRTINGEVRSKSGVVRITPVEEGWHRIERYATDKFPPEGDPVEVVSDQSDIDVLANCDANDPNRPPPPPGKGTRVRLLLAYTAAAETSVGNMNTFSDLLIDQLAQIWSSSSHFTVIPELAHVARVSYQESGSTATDLNRLQGRNDGHLEELHTLRDAHRADLVALLTASSDNLCGRAFLPYPPSKYRSDTGFSVTRATCALGNLSLAHELGHNFSLHHERAVAGSVAGRYNYGYSNLNLRLRSIMAYGKECSDKGFNCERLPTYSYPYPFIKDETIGKPIGSAGAAHNRNMFCLAAKAVSEYRQ